MQYELRHCQAVFVIRPLLTGMQPHGSRWPHDLPLLIVQSRPLNNPSPSGPFPFPAADVVAMATSLPLDDIVTSPARRGRRRRDAVGTGFSGWCVTTWARLNCRSCNNALIINAVSLRGLNVIYRIFKSFLFLTSWSENYGAPQRGHAKKYFFTIYF